MRFDKPNIVPCAGLLAPALLEGFLGGGLLLILLAVSWSAIWLTRLGVCQGGRPGARY